MIYIVSIDHSLFSNEHGGIPEDGCKVLSFSDILLQSYGKLSSRHSTICGKRWCPPKVPKWMKSCIDFFLYKSNCHDILVPLSTKVDVQCKQIRRRKFLRRRENKLIASHTYYLN